jgi:hypothetical protein
VQGARRWAIQPLPHGDNTVVGEKDIAVCNESQSAGSTLWLHSHHQISMANETGLTNLASRDRCPHTARGQMLCTYKGKCCSSAMP